MRKTSNALFICLAAAAGCLTASAQNQNLESGSVTHGRGIKIQYVTVAEPALKRPARLGFSGGFSFDANILHRWMLDRANQSYFGYDLVVEPIPATTQCRASILPFSLSPADINKHENRVELDSSWKLLQLPRYPAPQVVEPGDVIALDLLASPDGKQKVVDYLRASCKEEDKPTVAESGPARDFSLEDVPLNITSASLYVNGQPVTGTPVVGDVNGPIVWFYFPGKGRFLVSIAPHNEHSFRKAGTIRRNVISFEWGGDRYEVRGSHPVVMERGVWNTYVLFDPSYRPKRPNAEFGSSDRVENVLGER